MLVDRQRIQERLESGSRLARRADSVEVWSVREFTGAADICPHFAGGVLDHDHRAIIDAPVANIDDLATQRLDDEALEVAIERASRGTALSAEQTFRELRRERDMRGRIPAARECVVQRSRDSSGDELDDPIERLSALARIATVSRRAFGARIKAASTTASAESIPCGDLPNITLEAAAIPCNSPR